MRSLQYPESVALGLVGSLSDFRVSVYRSAFASAPGQVNGSVPSAVLFSFTSFAIFRFEGSNAMQRICP